jgi:hypothetical protein
MGKNACPAHAAGAFPGPGAESGPACSAHHPSKAKRVHALAAGPRPWTLGVRTAEALGTRPRLVRDPP